LQELILNMMELFKKIYIKEACDLPKEKGSYWSGHNDAPSEMDLRDYDPNDPDDRFVMRHLDWYLKPEEPANGLTDEEIEKKFPHMDYGLCNAIERVNIGFINSKNENKQIGAKWARSQMQGDEELIKNCPLCGNPMKGFTMEHYRCKKCKKDFTK